MLTALGSKEAEMRIIGCDLHTRQQRLAMLDRETGEVTEKTLTHEREDVRQFYAALPAPVVVGLDDLPPPAATQIVRGPRGLTCPGKPLQLKRD
jgi:hypothetical protein